MPRHFFRNDAKMSWSRINLVQHRQAAAFLFRLQGLQARVGIAEKNIMRRQIQFCGSPGKFRIRLRVGLVRTPPRRQLAFTPFPEQAAEWKRADDSAGNLPALSRPGRSRALFSQKMQQTPRDPRLRRIPVGDQTCQHPMPMQSAGGEKVLAGTLLNNNDLQRREKRTGNYRLRTFLTTEG